MFQKETRQRCDRKVYGYNGRSALGYPHGVALRDDDGRWDAKYGGGNGSGKCS